MSKVLASVGIFIEKSKKAEVLTGLCKIDGVKEVYEVAGEFDILSIVCVSSMAEFRETLQRQIMRVKGVSSVVTSIILAPHKHSKKAGRACVLKLFCCAFCGGFSSTKSRVGLRSRVCFGVLFGFSARIECRWKLKKEKRRQ